MNRYYKRGTQRWCAKKNGDILLINLSQPNYHYDGDAHIFFTLKKPGFDQTGGTRITREEWLEARDLHVKRIQDFS